jgi:hypothetical protein
MLDAVHMLKKLVIGGIVLVTTIVACAYEITEATGPAPAQQIVAGSRGDDQKMMADNLFARIIALADGAATEEDLQALLENDPLVQETGLNPGSDIMIGNINAGYCHLSPLLCLFRWHAPDLRCVYDCIGLRGTGEITCRQQKECVVLAGCMLFENCLALCISLIPHDLQPVIWW